MDAAWMDTSVAEISFSEINKHFFQRCFQALIINQVNTSKCVFMQKGNLKDLLFLLCYPYNMNMLLKYLGGQMYIHKTN